MDELSLHYMDEGWMCLIASRHDPSKIFALQSPSKENDPDLYHDCSDLKTEVRTLVFDC